jgi:hypothetical protein
MDFADFSRFGLRGACAHNVQRARDRTQQLFGEPVIMSIASLAAECARDASAPGNASTSSPSIDSAITNLVRFVPTEIVAVFLTIIGILGATIDNKGENVVYLLWLLVATILTPTFFALHFIAEYRRIHNGKWPSLRLFPIPGMITSVAAFLIWAAAVAPPGARSSVVQWVVQYLPYLHLPWSTDEITTHGGAYATALLLVVSPLWMSINRAFSLVANPDTATNSPDAASSIADANTSTQSPNASSVQESVNARTAHLVAG